MQSFITYLYFEPALLLYSSGLSRILSSTGLFFIQCRICNVIVRYLVYLLADKCYLALNVLLMPDYWKFY